MFRKRIKMAFLTPSFFGSNTWREFVVEDHVCRNFSNRSTPPAYGLAAASVNTHFYGSCAERLPVSICCTIQRWRNVTSTNCSKPTLPNVWTGLPLYLHMFRKEMIADSKDLFWSSCVVLCQTMNAISLSQNHVHEVKLCCGEHNGMDKWLPIAKPSPSQTEWCDGCQEIVNLDGEVATLLHLLCSNSGVHCITCVEGETTHLEEEKTNTR